MLDRQEKLPKKMRYKPKIRDSDLHEKHVAASFRNAEWCNIYLVEKYTVQTKI